ncbi:hypothetical protein BEN49_24455 [Hymenobacter coccineus]|uniref:Uncharacterized protein n=1 Tax=Hymenobacter coccineus TaxID=1908235 RepID=A0A1G1TG26_9BACT|nr:hypothetical protein BEN49_24455 [Hymenobacter coccineus]
MGKLDNLSLRRTHVVASCVMAPIRAVRVRMKGNRIQTLLSLNAWQLAGTRCQWATVGSREFKKLVYD